MDKAPLEGLIAASITPFDEGGNVRFESYGPMVERLLCSGVCGLFVCGSTGECMSLNSDERKAVVEVAMDVVDGRVPVLVHVGHNCLSDARDLARHAGTVGVEGISATCPSYFPINDVSTLVDCMAMVASGAPEVPFYYYHIPELTGCDVDMVEFLTLGSERIANLVGLKYTADDVETFQRCLELQDGRFDVFWGCDEKLVTGLNAGAKAAVGSSYNIATPFYAEVMDAFAAADQQRATQLQQQSVAMIDHMKEFSYLGSLKKMMEVLGMPGGSVRLPLRALTTEQSAQLLENMDNLGFFDWCGHPSDGLI